MRALGLFHVPDGQEGARDELETAFRDYCRLNLHQPVKTFPSVGEPRGPDGPGYLQMTDYVRASGGEYLLVVPDATELGADLEAVARSMVELEGMGFKVVCWDEDFPDPLQNGFQTLGVKGVSPTRSSRIKESMSSRALRGQALGRPPYGYRIGPDGALSVVGDEAPVVELIYRLYTKDGLGLRLIARELNGRGIATRRGGRWNVVSIRDILKNIAYIGTYSRLGMRRPNVHEAIIEPEVFRAAQTRTKERRPMGRVVSAEPYLLSGLAYCKYCGNKMMGVTRRQSWKRKDGRRASRVYRYYQCQSRNNQSLCSYHTWRAPLLESTVLGQLSLALRARDAAEGQDPAASRARRARVQGARESRVTHSERRLLAAIRRAARGEMSVTVLGEYLRELDRARRDADGRGGEQDIDGTLARWDDIDVDQRRRFLEDHVLRIIVEDEKIEVEV